MPCWRWPTDEGPGNVLSCAIVCGPHIGHELDGIIAKRAEAPYRPGDDRAAVKIKNYRTVDCVVGGFRDRSIGSTHDELLLGLHDGAGRLHYVASVDIPAKQKTT